MCHAGSIVVPTAGSIVVPTAGYSPNIPTITDTASFTPPISSGKSNFTESEDSCTYELDGGDDNLTTTYHLPAYQLSNESLYSSYTDDTITVNATFGHSHMHCGVNYIMQADGVTHQNPAVMPSGVPGLDDSLENSGPNESSLNGNDVDKEYCKSQSFFHEDLESWMQPTEDMRLSSNEEHTAKRMDFTHHSLSTGYSDVGFGSLGTTQSFDWARPAPVAGHGIPKFPYMLDSNLNVSRPLVHTLSCANSQNSETSLLDSNPNTSRPLVSGFSLVSAPNLERNVLNSDLNVSRPVVSSFSMVTAQSSERSDDPSVSRSCFSLVDPQTSEMGGCKLAEYKTGDDYEMPFFSYKNGNQIRLEAPYAPPSIPSTSLQQHPHIQCPPDNLLGNIKPPSPSRTLFQQATGRTTTDYQFGNISCPPMESSITTSYNSVADNHLIPRSSKIIASSTVRKPFQVPAVERIPVKALDLGLMDERPREARLQSNDRNLVATELAHDSSSKNSVLPVLCTRSNVGHGGEVVKSKYFISPAASSLGSSSGRIISSSKVCVGPGVLSDLTTFHQREGECLSRGSSKATAHDWTKSGVTSSTAIPVSYLQRSE